MSDSPFTPDDIFDAKDRLQLLQLLARRQMAERLAKQAVAASDPPDLTSDDDEEGDDEESPSSAALPIEIPASWKLIPEEISLHAWQKKCLPIWLEGQGGRGTVKVATGGGKTLFALAAMEALQNSKEPDLRVVIVVPTIPLMVQWKSELLRGNVPESAIALMGGGEQPGLLTNARILICVLNSARLKLPALVQKAGWPERMLLIVDECHRAKAAQAQKIFAVKARYTLGLSATPESADDDSSVPPNDAFNAGEVGQALGPIIFDFTLQDCAAAGLLAPFEVIHVGIDLAPDEAAGHASLSREISELRKDLTRRHQASRSKQPFIPWCQTVGGKGDLDAVRFIGLASERKRLLYRARARAAAVLGILKESLTDAESRAIVFHESVEEVDRLFLGALEAGLPAVLEHSKLPGSLRTESIEAFRDGTARVIVSAKSLVEGFNVPSADVGIIAASSGSVRQRIQSLGRMLRRKTHQKLARVWVLYVHDTTDEEIYEDADWERIVGAERNRYYRWGSTGEPPVWGEGLVETGKPPRIYRPPSSEIDTSTLAVGDPYLGQSRGVELKVDQSRNLRLASDDTLIPAAKPIVEAILQVNQYRKAVRTPPGHVIARKDGVDKKDAGVWRFVGIIDELPEKEPTKVVFKLSSRAGRKQITRESDANARLQPSALGPDKASNAEAGAARDTLLAWIAALEKTEAPNITKLYWDGAHTYWIDSGGERIEHPSPLPPLEFRE
jgi:superfamily II DNA or RNA helicase